ncbi:hypothetical protein, partial [Rhizobium sp. M1]|uniref:hypothetical protein n=1 Tax=Rhizobium sp. M1 TaxID=2035453 RepID=UPI001AEC853A
FRNQGADCLGICKKRTAGGQAASPLDALATGEPKIGLPGSKSTIAMWHRSVSSVDANNLSRVN